MATTRESGEFAAEKEASNIDNNDCIPGFEKVSWVEHKEVLRHSLSARSLRKSNKKLMLIQVPSGFDINDLSGKTVLLDGSQKLKRSKKLDDGGRYEINSTLDDSLNMYSVVCPSTSVDELQRVHPISGHMQIFKSWRIPPVNQECVNNMEENIDDHVYQMNWKPFGSRSPKSKKQRKRKRKDSKDDSTSASTMNVKQESALESDLSEVRSPKKKKKKKKRHHEDVKIEIKTEPGL